MPNLSQYCLKCCNSDDRNLLTVMEAGVLELKDLIQPIISLEMPVPSLGHYGFPSFPVVDWFCLFDLWVLPFPLSCPFSFDHFVISPSSIYCFWLTLYCLQLFLKNTQCQDSCHIYVICIFLRKVAFNTFYLYDELHGVSLIRGRNFFAFAGTWVHAGFLVGSVLLIFLAFCIVSFFIFVLYLVHNVASFSGFSILDFPFGFL